MDITFTCPHCGEVTLIDESFVGQTGECRACGNVVTVPRVLANVRRPAPVLSSIVRCLRWCNNYLAYVFIGIFVLGVLSVVVQPEIDNWRMVARRMESGNHLKQLALAMHNYHDTYNRLPRPYWLTAKRERTLSWRLAIEPFLESGPMHEIIRPEESWDSPSNQAMAAVCPSCYRGPWNRDDTSRETAYLVITGPGTLFEEGMQHDFKECTDGLANTILIVEVKRSGIAWNEPRDLDIRTMILQINASDSNGISSPWKGGAQVVMADGSVKFLSNDTLESTVRAMITRSGGETFETPK